MCLCHFSCRGHSRKQFHALLDLEAGKCEKLLRLYSFNNVLPQQSGLDVRFRNEHACVRQSLDLANVKKAFDFFNYAADGLNIALLIHRARHGNVLPQRQIGERGKRARTTCVNSRCLVHSGIRLLEKMLAASESAYPAEALRKKARNNVHALSWKRPLKFDSRSILMSPDFPSAGCRR